MKKIVFGIAICFILVYAKAQSTFGGWGGACTGTQATCQVLVNSTATKTVTATFTSTAPSGTFSIVNQPSGATAYFYPNGLTTKRLPSTIMNHLMPNSDVIIASISGEQANGAPAPVGTPFGGGLLTGHYASPGAQDGGENPHMYIGTASDPVYKPYKVKDCGPEFASLATKDSNGYITNLTFHAPNGATFSGTGGTTDNGLTIWDRSGLGISNNHTIGFYTCCGGPAVLPACPGNGHAGTQADPCPFTENNRGGVSDYCDWSDPVNGQDYGQTNGPTSTVGFSPVAASNRFQEILSGHIYHANFANQFCESTAKGAEPIGVFPQTHAGSALQCTATNVAPPNGALEFLDYTDAQLDCMNPDKPSCTGADGAPVAKIDRVQYTFIEQLAHYGAYETDTSGPANANPAYLTGTYHNESSEPYRYYSQKGMNPNPLSGSCTDCFTQFQNLMTAHCPGPYTVESWCYPQSRTAPNSVITWQTRIFYKMPRNLPGPTCSNTAAAANNCGVMKHYHIADPCVAVAMAGKSSFTLNGKTWNACP